MADIHLSNRLIKTYGHEGCALIRFIIITSLHCKPRHQITMVNTCVVPGCNSRSDRDTHLSFHALPLSNKVLLKRWIHQIGRKNLPINTSSRVCSRHFINSYFQVLSPDEYPTENLPHLPTKVSIPTPRRPLVRRSTVGSNTAGIEEAAGSCKVDVGVNTDDVVDSEEVAKLRERVAKLEEEAKLLQIEVAVLQKKDDMKMRLAMILGDDAKILFYTGFPSYEHLMVCFNFLGPAVAALEYRDSTKFPDDRSNKGRPRSLSPIDEFFMVLVRLRLGLLEQDVAYRFGISQPTVSRIFATWINFLYLQFQQIPLWPPKELIDAYMPNSFKQQYPSTRVIIDATEVFIQQPSLPELQQRTFSSYKNHNTYKGLVGISPSGAVTFVSNLYPGSISDKELTHQSGLLNLLQPGDSIMADRGFDIMEDLAPLGVKLNIPPFLRGKAQLDTGELVETRRIASLRIHVERCMERIKNFHIFDGVMPLSMMDISNQIFFVCAVLTNFHPPLCS